MNWKIIVTRIVVNAFTIALSAFILPGIEVVGERAGTYLILAVGLGLLNAFVKPAVQFFTLPLLFISYGLVIIAINAVILWLLAFVFSDLLVINSLWAALGGGILIGLIGGLLENIFGVTPPIIDNFDTLQGADEL